jgi:hypothetical protein
LQGFKSHRKSFAEGFVTPQTPSKSFAEGFVTPQTPSKSFVGAVGKAANRSLPEKHADNADLQDLRRLLFV